MRTFTSLEIRFEYVLVGKLPNRRIIRRKIRSCDSGITHCVNWYRIPVCKAFQTALGNHWHIYNDSSKYKALGNRWHINNDSSKYKALGNRWHVNNDSSKYKDHEYLMCF